MGNLALAAVVGLRGLLACCVSHQLSIGMYRSWVGKPRRSAPCFGCEEEDSWEAGF